MRSLFLFLSLFYWFPSSDSTCAFTQKCHNAAMGDCEIPVGRIAEPQTYNYTSTFQCPEFKGPVCCNDDQNTLLKNSFNLINYTFGSGASGCDICGINLRRFWCYFTCSPDQANYVNTYGNIVVPNPFTPGLNVTVLNVTLKIDPDTACEMYHSCQKTPYVSQVSAMNSAEGLLNFLGSNAVATGQEKITMIYTNQPADTPINVTLHGCNETFWQADQYGYPVTKNCTCNNCDTACGATADLDYIIKPMDVMDGFNSTVIIAFYCAIVAETLLCLLARHFFKGERKRKESRNLFVPNETAK